MTNHMAIEFAPLSVVKYSVLAPLGINIAATVAQSYSAMLLVQQVLQEHICHANNIPRGYEGALRTMGHMKQQIWF